MKTATTPGGVEYLVEEYEQRWDMGVVPDPLAPVGPLVLRLEREIEALEGQVAAGRAESRELRDELCRREGQIAGAERKIDALARDRDLHNVAHGELLRLAAYISANHADDIGKGDPVNGESAVDVAIRLLKGQVEHAGGGPEAVQA